MKRVYVCANYVCETRESFALISLPIMSVCMYKLLVHTIKCTNNQISLKIAAYVYY